MNKKGGTEWHLEQENNDFKYEGEGSSGYHWNSLDRVYMVPAKVAFDTLKMPDNIKELYMYMYTKSHIHYFKHSETREYFTTQEI